MRKRNESGSSLVLALSIVGVFMILLVSVSLFARTDLLSSQKQIGQTNAYYIAEAGLQRAVQDTNNSLVLHQTPASSFADPNFKGGSYNVTLTPRTNDSGENIGYTVRSTGTYKQESRTITAWLRPRITTTLSAFDNVLYASETISIRTLSGLLGIGPLLPHKIHVNGKTHGNGTINMRHEGILVDNPIINGTVSSTDMANIQVQGLDNSRKVASPYIPIPTFDFDRAREKAKSEGLYVSHDVANISLLGLSPTDKVIFIDGDLSLTGLDLLGISLKDRTIVVNGTFNGLLEVGGSSLVKTNLNIIAKEDINFLGAITGLKVNGILFAQGNNADTNQPDPSKGKISVAGHCDVTGFVGARSINMGAGILSSILSLITGDMAFNYHHKVFEEGYLPSGLGFQDNSVEIVQQEEEVVR